MGIVQAFAGALGGTFADQWKDIITAGYFDEHTVVVPGFHQTSNNGRGVNNKGSAGVISNGSKIFIPENTAAFIFDRGGIEEILTEPGGYTYNNGEKSVFSDATVVDIFKQVGERFTFGGQTSSRKFIAFVNLREIRGIKFGTRGPLIYNDHYYGTDLEVLARGSLSLRVTDPATFIRNYVPANTTFYSFDDKNAREQILSEFMQSFSVALNSLSSQYRISQLPAKSNEIAIQIADSNNNAGTWGERFGFEIIKVGIENIEFSPESKELVKEFSSKKMNIKAYDEVSQKTSNIAAQQQIAKGVENHGLGDGAGMIFGMNMAQNIGGQAEVKPGMSLDEQIESLKKLKDLVDMGILTQEEFEVKKKEIMGL